jgi:uncharacterized membrane protein YuzA (DUF378 family)
MNQLLQKLYSITFAVVALAGIQWGLIGIGGLMNKNFNFIYKISFGSSTVEYGIYLVIGIISILFIWLSAKFDN